MMVVHRVLYLNEGMIVAATSLRILSWGSVDLDGMAGMLGKDFNPHKVSNSRACIVVGGPRHIEPDSAGARTVSASDAQFSYRIVQNSRIATLPAGSPSQ